VILRDVHRGTSLWAQVAARNGLSKPDQIAMAPAFRHRQAELAGALIA
jgi:hypothetical protein